MNIASENANQLLLFRLAEAQNVFSMISDYMRENNKPNFADDFKDCSDYYSKAGQLLFLLMAKAEQAAVLPLGVGENAELTSFKSYSNMFYGKNELPFNKGGQAILSYAREFAKTLKQLAYKSAKNAILDNDPAAMAFFKDEGGILWTILVTANLLEIAIFSSLYSQGVAIIPNKIEVESSISLSQTDFDGVIMQFIPRSDMSIMWVPNEDGSIHPGEKITSPMFGEARAIRVSDPALQDYFMELATKQCAALS